MPAARLGGWRSVHLHRHGCRPLWQNLIVPCSLQSSSLSTNAFLPTEASSIPHNRGSFESLARTFAAIEDHKNARAASVKLLASGYRQLLTLPTSKELASALSLTASQLAPAYKGVELRFGAKSFLRLLKQLDQEGEDGESTQTLEKLLATYPDYGHATEALLESGRIAAPTLENEGESEPLSIRTVHEQLMAIAKDEGAGGVARKQQLALQLLQQCRYPEERIFIVRMLAHQSLRIGMGEKSILAAVASASFPSSDSCEGENNGITVSDLLVQEKDWVEAVTLAYAQHPNYHVLAEVLHANQKEADIVEKIRQLQNQARPVAGVPVLTMSAYPVSSIAAVLGRVSKANSRTATCEYKYDGARVQVHLSLPTDGKHSNLVRRIFSRNMEDVTDRFSSLLDVLQQHVVARNSKQKSSAISSFIVEGEVVALDRASGTFRPFQVLQTKTTTEFCLYLFDMLAVDGTNLLQKSLRERRSLLHNLLDEEPGYVEFVEHVDVEIVSSEIECAEDSVKFDERVRACLDQAVSSGCEGLMVKLLDDDVSEYKAGRRSYSWMKLKQDYISDDASSSLKNKKATRANASGNGTFLADTLDLVPIGAFYGKGKRTGVFGSFLMATYNSFSGKFETIGKVGTGFSDAQLSEVAARLEKQILPKADEVPDMYQSQMIRSRHPDVWLSPSEVWEIKATQLTESPSYSCGIAVDALGDAAVVPARKGLALRFPRFVRYRPDKKPLQATDSEQVLELFSQQQQQIPHYSST